MSKETEKMFNQLNQFLEEHDNGDLDETALNKLLDQFMEEYEPILPRDRVTEETAKTADDFLELAMRNPLDRKKSLGYARQAKQLDPDNLDAERIIAELSSKDDLSLLKKLKRAISQGDKLMQRMGYNDDDCIGNYWGIVETRPYMRLRMSYLNTLLSCGMMRRAVEEGEEMIQLCTNDNLGIRFTLMHLYAYLEEEDPALALLERYNYMDETQMMLPLSALYFKLGRFDTANFYLRCLKKCNPDSGRFIRMMAKMDEEMMDKELLKMNPIGYRFGTIEEFFSEFEEHNYLFETLGNYFLWADKQLRRRKK